MLNKRMLSGLFYILFSVVLTQSLSAETADNYSPYPGVLVAKLVAIHSPSNIELSAQTWPGYRRNFSISLKAIETPEISPDVDICQRKLAEKTLAFIKDFLEKAKKIEIHDMTMKTSSDKNAKADIYSEQGSLSKALLNQGLARPIDTPPNKPWC